MAYRLTWQAQAAEDLDEIYEYIALENPKQAAKVARQLYYAARAVCDNPWLGRQIPELEQENVRERIVGRYRIAYLVKPQEVVILTVWHSARRISELLQRLKG
ncbi:hypothetical protein ABS71_03030 [bacterium SCN 62-11]|nr:type II toxin-antitoxin system RelE/ParE family toxin [Candidatus Eremiobacteraeota bacterium]ODT76741.1 MAG: hypothetical protein ABS71_03030 [bacterium SCN 62-11]